MKSDFQGYSDEADELIRRHVAANIRALRRIRHLTQAELARRIGIQAGPMNAIEQGKHIPSGRVLYRLAEVLQCTVDAILGRPARDPEVVASGDRDRPLHVAEAGATYVASSGTDTARPHALAVPLTDDCPLDHETRCLVNEIINSFLALEDLCGAQKRAHVPLYLPFVATSAGLDALTQQVRQIMGVGQGVIFDYLELFENAGLRVVFCPLPEAVQSAAFYDATNSNAFLVVRDGMNVERQLFELAKRLGAIYLYTRNACCPSCAGPVPGALDDLHAARRFAALFLMPSSAVRASVAQLGIGPGDWTYDLLLRIKHRFGVSAQSFLLRLKELELVASEPAVAIESRIEAHYRRTGFGEPDASRRVLSPNGRLGDLLLAAIQKPGARAEARNIEKNLRKLGMKWKESAFPLHVRGPVPGVGSREREA